MSCAAQAQTRANAGPPHPRMRLRRPRCQSRAGPLRRLPPGRARRRPPAPPPRRAPPPHPAPPAGRGPHAGCARSWLQAQIPRRPAARPPRPPPRPPPFAASPAASASAGRWTRVWVGPGARESLARGRKEAGRDCAPRRRRLAARRRSKLCSPARHMWPGSLAPPQATACASPRSPASSCPCCRCLARAVCFPPGVGWMSVAGARGPSCVWRTKPGASTESGAVVAAWWALQELCVCWTDALMYVQLRAGL